MRQCGHRSGGFLPFGTQAESKHHGGGGLAGIRQCGQLVHRVVHGAVTVQQPRGQRGKALGDAVTLGYADACAGRPRDEQRPLRQRQQTLRVANLDTGVGQRIGKSGVFGPILHGDFGIRHGPVQRQLAGQNAPHGCVHDLHRQCAIFHRSPQCPDAGCLHIAAIGVGIVTADNKITLRMATPDDAAAVCALYNWYVRHGTQTFQYAPSTAEEYRANIAHVRENAPFILAESADGRLQGFACAHLWHEREAYSWDVETTVYCAPDCVGQGVGGRLYRALLALLKAQGYYNAFALVAGNNRQSNDFHRAMGFKKMATEKRTGYKFGQWLDLDYWVMVLHEGDGEPQPVRKTLTDAEIAEAMG